MVKLLILCGLQCSGKSTWAKTQKDYTIVSSDEMRLKYPLYDNERIFKEVYKVCNDLLSQGINCILDATNTTIKSRRKIFENIKIPCEINCYIFNTPYKECLKRLKVRNTDPNSHHVPEEVLNKYLKSFEIPFKEEGFANIDVHFKPDFDDCIKEQFNILFKCDGFDQQNMHHTQDLLKHMKSVKDYIDEKYFNKAMDNNDFSNISTQLSHAAIYHDIGKLFTQTFKENDPNAHYYNHANVGAYYLLCTCGIYQNDETWTQSYQTNLTLDWLFYINYHMVLYNIKNEKSEKKWRKIFEDFKYNNLLILNEADKGGK